jgi:hypothetical protein
MERLTSKYPTRTRRARWGVRARTGRQESGNPRRFATCSSSCRRRMAASSFWSRARSPTTSFNARLSKARLERTDNIEAFVSVGPPGTSNTLGGTERFMAMQADGNFVMYTPTFQPVWATVRDAGSGRDLRAHLGLA